VLIRLPKDVNTTLSIQLEGVSKTVVCGQLYLNPFVDPQQIKQRTVCARRLFKLYKRLLARGN